MTTTTRRAVRSEERLRRIERLTEVPLTMLALVMIPLLLTPLIVELPPAVDQAITAGDWFIWAAFAVDYGVKLTVAPRPLEYARRNWIQALVVFLPFLRPLRLLALFRLGRVAAAVGLNVQLLRSLAYQRGTSFVLAAVMLIAVLGATTAFFAERDAASSNIRTFGDSLWWTLSTMTTVGYGDRYPVTALGRGVALALMLFGIAALSALTATVAAYIVRDHEDVQLADLMSELRALREEVATLQNAASPPAPQADDTTSLDTLT
ncbi:MAG: potassium channel family protein [Dehalococcoidia bacterium]